MDILGVEQLCSATAHRLVEAQDSPALILDLLKPLSDETLLSRNTSYYAPTLLVRPMAEMLAGDLRGVEDLRPGRLSPEEVRVHQAFAENIENVLLAVANAAHAAAIDLPASEQRRAMRRRWILFEAAVHVAGLQICREIGLLIAPLPPTVWAEVSEALLHFEGEPLRPFRELDHRRKIDNECSTILGRIRHLAQVEQIVCPLYGAIRLGVHLIAWQRYVLRRDVPVPVTFIRLGFHDQKGIDYRDSAGEFRWEALVPVSELELLAHLCRGRRVLIVDDNIGYGTTMRGARELVSSAGGVPLVRCCETAWHLFDRNPEHTLADVVEFPSPRSNLHHTLQAELIAALTRNGRDYLRRAAEAPDTAAPERMRRNVQRPDAEQRWTSEQLEWMRGEVVLHGRLLTENATEEPTSAAKMRVA